MNKSKSKGFLLTAILLAVTIVVVIFTLFLFLNKSDNGDTIADSENSSDEDISVDDNLYIDYTKINYDGKTYAYNTDIKTVLFLGVDQFSDSSETEEIVGGRSDTMVLLIVNNAEESITMLNISRDTQTEVNVYSTNGDYLSSTVMSLALQYNYGDGEERSCLYTKNAVSKLLYDIPINYYLSMDLDDLNSIVNNIGGIDVYMSNDYTYVNPLYIKGEIVHLDGAMAEEFIRYRDLSVLNGNEIRMDRQEDFLTAFLEKTDELREEDEEAVTALTQMILPYVLTDMDAETINRVLSYEVKPESYRLPGETILGEEHYEFFVEHEAMGKLIVDLFYVER